jgi:hypothetical protein
MKDDLGSRPGEDSFDLPGDGEVGLPPAEVRRRLLLRQTRNRVDTATSRDESANEMRAKESRGTGD